VRITTIRTYIITKEWWQSGKPDVSAALSLAAQGQIEKPEVISQEQGPSLGSKAGFPVCIFGASVTWVEV
jgi:hypothetical protein